MSYWCPLFLQRVFNLIMGTCHNTYIKIKKAHTQYCYYCNAQLSNNKTLPTYRTIDHFIPRSKGGGNDNDNKIICCRRCNKMKGDFMPLEFIGKLERLLRYKAFQVFSEAEIHNIIYKVTLRLSTYENKL